MATTLLNTSCGGPADKVDLRSLDFIVPTIVLALLNIVVIIGNVLVIAAVCTSVKLRTVTNTFIVSLAMADLCVGVLVLPFSNANEVMHYWVFGSIWCSAWLAIDVWLCTASILNLCAISLDRYLAISKPFKYHSLMSPKRGKILLAFVWIFSFLICFPPLIGWNEQGKGIGNRFDGQEGEHHGEDGNNETNTFLLDILPVHTNDSYHLYNISQSHEDQGGNLDCQDIYPECGLTAATGYIIYSALGSFYIPMAIMVFFYWKIYRTAVKTTAALKRGMLNVKTGTDFPSHSEDAALTLRIHRGGGAGQKLRSTSTASIPGTSTMYAKKTSTNMSPSPSLMEHSLCENNVHHTKRDYLKESNRKDGKSRVRLKDLDTPTSDCPLLVENHIADSDHHMTLGTSHLGDEQRKVSQTSNASHESRLSFHYLGANCSRKISQNSQISQDSRITESRLDFSMDDNAHTSSAKSGKSMRKIAKRNLRTALRKLNKEKKAAKTVGIIVGCFIFCWLPFFSVYLFGAFCPECTPPLVFSIFFWLGYCNSALNPCIYALFAKDFRYAFKKLLSCRCRVESSIKKKSGILAILQSFRVRVPSSRGSDSNSE